MSLFRTRYNQARIALVLLLAGVVYVVAVLSPGVLWVVVTLATAAIAGFVMVLRGLSCPHCNEPVLRADPDNEEGIDIPLLGEPPRRCERCGGEL